MSNSITTHLLEILKLIFNSNQNIIDEKSCFRDWIKKWISDKKYVYQVFCDEISDQKKIDQAQIAHQKFAAKYSQCYFTYNDMFITDLLNYVLIIYYHLFNKNCKRLNECIDLLTKLKQNMFYETQNIKDMIDVYPSPQNYRDKFENHGRALMKYYHFRKMPFIIHSLLKDPEYEINNNNNISRLKLNFYNLITLITSNNDKEWLEFLHGPILNIKYAQYQHAVFCNKHQYEKDGIWSCDIVILIEDFYVYLKQINKCLFNEKYMERKSEEWEIWFPNIPVRNEEEEEEEEEEKDEGNEISSMFYYNSDKKTEMRFRKKYNYVIPNQNYDIILKQILPLWKIKYTIK